MSEEKNMEAVELSDDQLDGVSGGYLYKNDKGEWEVIDSKGNVVGGGGGFIGEDEADAIFEAETAAMRTGNSLTKINRDQLMALRNANKK